MPLNTAVAIVDPDDLIEELGLGDPDYRRIERLVNVASSRLERALNTVIRPRKFLRVFDGDGNPILDLGGPIRAVHNIVVRDSGVVDPATYTVDPAGRVILNGAWPVGVQNVTVDCTLGMDPIPDEAREAVILYVKRMFSTSGDLRSEHIGDYSYERFPPSGEADVPDDVEALVSHLRRWRFG